MLGDDLVDRGLDRVPVADVQRQRVRRDAGRGGDLRGHLLAGLGLAAGDDDSGAGLGQRVRDRPAEPAGGAGDESDLAVELPGAALRALIGSAPSGTWAYFLSSRRAMVRRCTSLGPSAICSARVIEKSRASTVSSLTPAAPQVWTARLTTSCAVSIAATLIAATSVRAAALPRVSISQAALKV